MPQFRLIHGCAALCVAAMSGAMLSVAAGANDHAATAEIKNAQGQTIGRAHLTEGPQGVVVHLKLEKAPAGDHAFHLHTTGRCDGPTFESAGGHFNPTKAAHGMLSAKGAHLGDLPNIHVPASGQLDVEFFARDAQLSGKNALLDQDGAAVVMHAKPDDYKTDPAGAAGDRIACGVITR